MLLRLEKQPSQLKTKICPWNMINYRKQQRLSMSHSVTQYKYLTLTSKLMLGATNTLSLPPHPKKNSDVKTNSKKTES
jgi:hypothetical protein